MGTHTLKEKKYSIFIVNYRGESQAVILMRNVNGRQNKEI